MSKFFINRPIVAMVIAIFTVIIGAVTVLGLPVAQFPAIAPPEVQVSAIYVGADAQTIEQSVATPIEQQMSGVDNMNYMYSLNATANGQMRMIVDFDVATDPNTDLILAQSRETQAASQLPADVNNFGVTVQKSVLAPLMLVALYSPKGTYDARFLANYAYINLVDQLTRVKGVGTVQVFGAGQYAMRLWVKPDQLAKLQITVPEIVSAIQTQNTVNPAGQVGSEPIPKGQPFTYSVRAQGRLTSPEEFEQIVIRETPETGIVRVERRGASGIGRAGLQRDRPPRWKAERRHRRLSVAGVQRRRYRRRRKKAVRRGRSSRFPDDVDYTIPVDTTRAVNEGIKEIVETLLIAIVLVVAVVYLFLQGWRSTLIPLLAVPVSLIGTFIFFPLFGFSINTLSLFGLVLAIGLVVDDAIVVVEAVERHIEDGLAPKASRSEGHGGDLGPGDRNRAGAFRGVRAHGVHPRHHRQALSAVRRDHRDLGDPVGVQRALAQPRARGTPPEAEGGEQRDCWRDSSAGSTGLSAAATNAYVRLSGALLRKSAFALVLLAGFAAAGVWIGGKLPSSFVPDEDAGLLLPECPASQRRFPAANRRGGREDPEDRGRYAGRRDVTSVSGFSLLSLVRTSYNAFAFISMKEWGSRKTRAEQFQAIKARLNAELSKLPEARSLRLLAARDSRRRHLRRVHLHSRRPVGRRRKVPLGQPEHVHGRRAQTPGDRQPEHHLPAQRAAAVRRGRSRQGHQAGRRHQRRVPHHPGLHGRPVRQLLQSLRTPMAGLRRSRRRLSHQARERRPVLCEERQRARWSRCPR